MLNTSDLMLAHIEDAERSFVIEKDIRSRDMDLVDKDKIVHLDNRRAQSLRALAYFDFEMGGVLGLERAYIEGCDVDPFIKDRAIKGLECIATSVGYLNDDLGKYEAFIKGDAILEHHDAGVPFDLASRAFAEHIDWLGEQKPVPIPGLDGEMGYQILSLRLQTMKRAENAYVLLQRRRWGENKIVENKIGDYQSVKIDGLDADYDVLVHLKGIQKGFGVENDIRSGSMLAPDKEKLDSIMKDRLAGFEIIEFKEGPDNILAFEKVYAEGSKDADNIDRVNKIIDGFRTIEANEGEDYKKKVQDRGWTVDMKPAVPFDDCNLQLDKHAEWLHGKNDSASGSELDILCERRIFTEILRANYQHAQEQVLYPEIEIARIREARAEMGI